MLLSQENADFIYDELSSLCPIPVYITDEDGTILSGADESYIGRVSSVAQNAIRKNGREEVVPTSFFRMQGIAFPFHSNDQPIGACIIAGSIKQCEHYIRLISFAVSSLLERTTNNSQGVYRRQMIESWVINLINEDFTDWDDLESTARSLGIQTDTLSNMVVLRTSLTRAGGFTPFTSMDPTFIENLIIHTLNNIIRINFYCYIGRNRYVFCFGRNSSLSAVDPSPSRNELIAALNTLDKRWEQINLQCLYGIGEPSRSLKGLRKSYQEALRGLELARKFKVAKPMMIYDWGIINIMSQIPKEVVNSLYTQYFEKAPEIKPELIDTAELFFRNNCSVQQTADELMIHKNTLLYRLKRLRELLHLDPTNFEDAFILQLYIYLKKLHPTLSGTS